jgi:hypothetical protein
MPEVTAFCYIFGEKCGLTPKHLELTYKGRRMLDFQAVKCHGVDISVRDLSDGTSLEGSRTR